MKRLVTISLVILIAIIDISFTLFSEENKSEPPILLTKNTEFVAGKPINLTFNIKDTAALKLYIHHSYSQTVLKPKFNKKTAKFQFPEFLTNKTGALNWFLIEKNKKVAEGQLIIKPSLNTEPTIESYFGPRSIQAGDRDYSMLVIAPVDAFDNPLPDSTTVNIHRQFYLNIDTITVYMEKFMAWKNIPSYRKTGDIHISSEVNGINSIELTSNVLPSNATDFTIQSTRNHDFADGNQVATFTTSIIRDEWGNVVSDGTFVTFYIKNKENLILTTRGTTINGIATAKTIHPDHPESWSVKAYVTGLSESDEISLQFRSVLKNFNINFSENNRIIQVGPLHSFMNQLIPDGAQVTLMVYHENELVDTKHETSNDGLVTFRLQESFYPEKSYHFIVKALGIEKPIGRTFYGK
ncbi:hypothetical protein [Zunongwangia sp.]|uniref:hypothetical protein n=1 Tax=Zunongwangia sp. TaxID=1965325 RepID=UPI003AA7FE14